MSAAFEELDRRATPLGEISLRRRLEPTLGLDVFEASLGDEFLMSSLFTAAEVALARLGLAPLDGDALDVVVGGLGLGYTADAVLADARVRSLVVVEALDAVIDWHRRQLLPLSPGLVGDERCHLVEADFFATIADALPFDAGAGAPAPVHAILVDIDHSPRRLLHPGNASLYDATGLRAVAERLHPGGVFALWSDDPPDDAFLADAAREFATCSAEVVEFPNPLTVGTSTNTVYVAKAHGAGDEPAPP